MFQELSVDFGSVPRGPTLSHPFRLTNNTGRTVHISSVRVSCGCVRASALDTVLAPGQSTAIQAAMDTRRFLGTKAITIYVSFDQPHRDEVRLWVQANSRRWAWRDRRRLYRIMPPVGQVTTAKKFDFAAYKHASRRG
jgi:hypothetical protein